MPERDVVEEARELANDARFDIQPRVRSLLASLCDEVEALRVRLNDPCLVAGYHVCGGAHNLSDLTKG